MAASCPGISACVHQPDMHLQTYLALVEGLSLDLPLLLEAVNNILVSPTNLVRQPLQSEGQHTDPETTAQTGLTLTVQYLRPGFNRSTLRASGTTMRFLRS